MEINMDPYLFVELRSLTFYKSLIFTLLQS